ncbi:hypothetical protein [Spirosoma fluviale]|uniref:Uncharacterized protein n=1 Tax=Spirosoma fluviale TaxID=1597977 RepID=A0A286FDF2_9BACT|nr:hypothetical protein [Spirosoma fluviale]SOD80854.1 hypothetical protein SAMN06269250_1589 [Spirosoma fluviale]
MNQYKKEIIVVFHKDRTPLDTHAEIRLAQNATSGYWAYGYDLTTHHSGSGCSANPNGRSLYPSKDEAIRQALAHIEKRTASEGQRPNDENSAEYRTLNLAIRNYSASINQLSLFC